MNTSGPAKFGSLTAMVSFALILTIGPVAMFLAIGILLVPVSIVMWRRTRLPLVAASTALGSLASVAIAWLAFTDAPHWALLALACAVGFVFILCGAIEKRWHPEKMNTLKRATENATLADMLRMKHIPKLSGRDASALDQSQSQ